MANSSSFAQQIIVKESQVYNTDGIPDEQAALIGCAVSTGVGAVRNLARVQSGEIVIVIGIGGIGVNAIHGARLAEAARIVAVDVDRRKLASVGQYGATDSVVVERSDNPKDLADRILAVVPRVDVVIECSGAPTAMEAATMLPYIGGRAVFIGLPPPDTHVRFNASTFTWGRSFVSGLNGGTTAGASFQRLVDDVRAGAINVAAQVSRIWPLEQVEEAIAALRAGDVTRAVLDMR
jgi:S-(hydroxymethyl)glutathione dehydrogenase/alcohol dehydrogenase